MNWTSVTPYLFVWLVLCSLMCFYRIGRGPTAPDRAMAVDILGVIIIGFCALLALTEKTDYYMNVAIAWSLISFVGTLALAKHLEGKSFDE